MGGSTCFQTSAIGPGTTSLTLIVTFANGGSAVGSIVNVSVQVNQSIPGRRGNPLTGSALTVILHTSGTRSFPMLTDAGVLPVKCNKVQTFCTEGTAASLGLPSGCITRHPAIQPSSLVRLAMRIYRVASPQPGGHRAYTAIAATHCRGLEHTQVAARIKACSCTCTFQQSALFRQHFRSYDHACTLTCECCMACTATEQSHSVVHRRPHHERESWQVVACFTVDTLRRKV